MMDGPGRLSEFVPPWIECCAGSERASREASRTC